MAINTLPRTTLQQVFRPAAGIVTDDPRYCGIIAKTLPIKLFQDAEIVRGFIEGKVLTFSGVTYTASLGVDPAINDKSRSKLKTSAGLELPPTKWNYAESTPGSGTFDLVVLHPSVFSTSVTYTLDYITSNEDYEDEIPVDNLREVLRMGDQPGQVLYEEGVDYRFVTTATGPTPGDDNANPTGTTISAVTKQIGAGTGTVTVNSGAEYTGQYNRAYVLTCTAAAGSTPNRTATLVVTAQPTSSGTDFQIGLSTTQLNQITLELDETDSDSLNDVAVELGISLDFAFGASNFIFNADPALTNTFTFQANGPGILELSDEMLSTAQFSSISAVEEVSVAGEGTITINPQSDFDGDFNQSYEVECTAVTASPDKDATFRYRGKPELLCLTGTVTATITSNLVDGVGTAFTSEVAIGDLLYIGDDAMPVTVASITSATRLVLSVVYAPATTTGVKVLRVRQVTGSFTVDADDPLGVEAIGDGVILDFDFGTDTGHNFDEGDTFSFTTGVARRDYNGTENREYGITVATIPSNSHTMTVSYAGDTATSGFGTHVFSEGNPLVLSNNVVIEARNLSLANRYSTSNPPLSTPDTFSLSLLFDNLIDWTLDDSAVETISSADIQRDLTGVLTGTVGAFFVTVRNVPTEVLFVKNTSTGVNIEFNTVADSDIIWFTSNPAVNMTVSYRYKGIEPSMGASYFLSGYVKRPSTDYEKPFTFTSRQEAALFLAPMTPQNDAAIANEVAWDQAPTALPGVVICLVNDPNEDGIYTSNDYIAALRISEQIESKIAYSVINRFDIRDEAFSSDIAMNDPAVGRQRILVTGFPVDYPIGDEFTADSRIFVARREMQVFQATPARGTLAGFQNSWATKIINVNALGDGAIGTFPTEVTLDGSYLALALAALVCSRQRPWEIMYNLQLSGFESMEELSVTQLSLMQNSGLIGAQVVGAAQRIATQDVTPDNTEPSTHFLAGTTQRQFITSRVKAAVDAAAVGYVPESPEDAAQVISSAVVGVLLNAVAQGDIGQYVTSTGQRRDLNPSTDVAAYRDAVNPAKAYFQFCFFNKYGLYDIAGVYSVDGPRPGGQ
jgi:hypothetical protein